MADMWGGRSIGTLPGVCIGHGELRVGIRDMLIMEASHPLHGLTLLWSHAC